MYASGDAPFRETESQHEERNAFRKQASDSQWPQKKKQKKLLKTD